MQTKPLYRLIFTTGAALVAAIITLATPTVRAGLFDIPSEPANWNGPFVSFDSGGVWSNFDWSNGPTTVDLTRQFNIATGTTNVTSGVFVPNDATTPNFLTFMAPGHSSDDSAYIAGIDLGYNKQIGHFVIGGELGFTGTKVLDQSGFRDSASGTIFVNPSSGSGDVFFDTDFRSIRKVEQLWAGSIGAKVGFAWNRFFVYANGGGAFAQIDVHSLDRVTTDFSVNIIPVVGPDQGNLFIGTNTQKKLLENDTDLVGWYVGGGLQFAFTDTVSAGVEYRHNDYGDTEFHLNVGNKGTSALFPGEITVNNDNNEVMFKVTVLLGNLGEKKAVEGMSKK